MGGFMLALAMQRWGLHRRIALLTVRAVGTNPVQMIGGFMLATGFLSMWVSNTATTVAMLPIGLSILVLVLGDQGAEPGGEVEEEEIEQEQLTGQGASNFATCLMLAIAYAASIGSLSTLIGTPPNVFMAELSRRSSTTSSIGFGEWMLVGLPLSVVFLFISLVRADPSSFIRRRWTRSPAAGRLFKQQLDEMGAGQPRREGGADGLRAHRRRLDTPTPYLPEHFSPAWSRSPDGRRRRGHRDRSPLIVLFIIPDRLAQRRVRARLANRGAVARGASLLLVWRGSEPGERRQWRPGWTCLDRQPGLRAQRYCRYGCLLVAIDRGYGNTVDRANEQHCDDGNVPTTDPGRGQLSA